MTESNNNEKRMLQVLAGGLLVMRFIFSLDWMGLMNLLVIISAMLLFFGRLNGKFFPLAIGGAAVLQGVDAVMGIVLMVSIGIETLPLFLRTALLAAFIIMFAMRFFGNKLSDKQLFIGGILCVAVDFFMSAFTGCVEMPVMGQTAFIFALLVVLKLQDDEEESSTGDFLSKTGLALTLFGIMTVMWGIAAGTEGSYEYSSLFKLFGESVSASRNLDLVHLLPGVNWNLISGSAGTAIGVYMLTSGRKMNQH